MARVGQIGTPDVLKQQTLASFTTQPGLNGFSVSPAAFLASRPAVHNLVAGAMVFRSMPDASTKSTHYETLLLQRAPSDSFPLKWEIPAGTADPSTDQSIFDVAARELWEETGLRAQKFLLPVGLGLPEGVSQLVCQGEAEGASMDSDLEMCLVQVLGQVWAVATFITEVDDSGQGVLLQAEEHVAWAWVTEDEVKTGRFAGGLHAGQRLELSSEAMEMTILQGFKLRKSMISD